jgi:hypothetical protein
MYYQKIVTETDGETKTSTPTLTLKAIAGLNLLQAAMRLIFVYIMMTGGIGEFLETEISGGTLASIGAVFLFLGVAGIVSVIGVIKQRGWGVKAILGVNILTILFDVWGYTVQSSALLGFIVPAITILLVVVRKHPSLETR